MNFTKLRQWLAPPVFADEEQTRIAGLLNTILLSSLAAVLTLSPVFILLDERLFYRLANLAMSATTLFLALSLLFLVRRGHVQAASVLLSVMFLFIITLSVYLFGGLASPIASSYIVIIVTAGLLLGGRAAIIFALLSMLLLLGVGWVLDGGTLTSGTFSSWILYVVIEGLMAAVLRLVLNSIQSTLERARRNERALAESNRELQAIQASLGQRVTERTRALQEVNTALSESYYALQENQARLLISEKMASLGRLTAGVAHEINTPLAAVRASLAELDKLALEYQDSIGDQEVEPGDHQEIAQEMRETIRRASSAAERAAGFVRSMKTQTRNHSTEEKQPFNAVPVAQEALLLLQHALRQTGCTLAFEPESQEIELYGSPGRFAQVVTNLASNAIDASAANGGGPVIVRLRREADGVSLQVSDYGVGIAPENISRIFEPMFTTKPFGEGTGLGLTIVHDIVVGEFGGTIEVSSQPELGTVFQLHFPKASHEND
ncbi:MAG: ATP-binding protein [Chloroflexi bacterium]|nr:ATP-binding protein [Chloroflexota bacterium]MCI0580675.1 ATP-binding protein [Chloroflexota bacterium]MCI0644736.1 ATP-binding protein [Chloroflexota bacterium]MCI0728641.1 ATP-binding protein [Chloroflexota bacterium]